VIGVDKQMDEEAMKTVLTLLSKEREERAKQDRSVAQPAFVAMKNNNGSFHIFKGSSAYRTRYEVNFNPNGCIAGDLTDCI
jgi:hypothetical protein